MPILTRRPTLISTQPTVITSQAYTQPLAALPAPFLLSSQSTYYPIDEVTVFYDETQAETASCNDEDVTIGAVQAEQASLKDAPHDEIGNVPLRYDIAKALKAAFITTFYSPWF